MALPCRRPHHLQRLCINLQLMCVECRAKEINVLPKSINSTTLQLLAGTTTVCRKEQLLLGEHMNCCLALRAPQGIS